MLRRPFCPTSPKISSWIPSRLGSRVPFPSENNPVQAHFTNTAGVKTEDSQRAKDWEVKHRKFRARLAGGRDAYDRGGNLFRSQQAHEHKSFRASCKKLSGPLSTLRRVPVRDQRGLPEEDALHMPRQITCPVNLRDTPTWTFTCSLQTPPGMLSGLHSQFKQRSS